MRYNPTIAMKKGTNWTRAVILRTHFFLAHFESTEVSLTGENGSIFAYIKIVHSKLVKTITGRSDCLTRGNPSLPTKLPNRVRLSVTVRLEVQPLVGSSFIIEKSK